MGTVVFRVLTHCIREVETEQGSRNSVDEVHDIMHAIEQKVPHHIEVHQSRELAQELDAGPSHALFQVVS